MAVPQDAMPQLGSVCAASPKPLTAASSEKECSKATARLTWACAVALHDVLKSTVPSFSDWAETGAARPMTNTKDAKAVESNLSVMTHLLLRVRSLVAVEVPPGGGAARESSFCRVERPN